VAKAVDYFSRALEHGPEDPTTLLHLAEALAQGGQSDEAGKVLERLIAAYPYARPYRRLLAICYLKGNDEQRARKVMKQQLEFFPEDSVVRDLLKKLERRGLDAGGTSRPRIL
jgi:predicted Zn-dependent protease